MDLVMSALFHDLGKSSTSKKSEDGDWNSSFGHENASSQLVLRYKDWIQEMGANPYVVNEIVKNHMKIKFNGISPKDKKRLDRYTIFQKLTKFADADNMKKQWNLDEGLNLPKKINPELKVGDTIRIIKHKDSKLDLNLIYTVTKVNYRDDYTLKEIAYYVVKDSENVFWFLYPHIDQYIKIATLHEGLNLPKKSAHYLSFIDREIKYKPGYKERFSIGDRIIYKDQYGNSWGTLIKIIQYLDSIDFILRLYNGEYITIPFDDNILESQPYKPPLWEGLNLPKKAKDVFFDWLIIYPNISSPKSVEIDLNGMTNKIKEITNLSVKLNDVIYISEDYTDRKNKLIDYIKITITNLNPQTNNNYLSGFEFEQLMFDTTQSMKNWPGISDINYVVHYYDPADYASFNIEFTHHPPVINVTQKIIQEGLNLPKKKYPDKITGDYPDGYWEKREYNNNGYQIYYEDSNGYWSKSEYDNNGNQIYSENSNGNVEDNRDQINEGLNLPKKKYPDKIIGDYPDGNGKKIIYWSNGNVKERHTTYSSNDWGRSEYDQNGNEIYFEDSSGYWRIQEYDRNGNEIYFEDSVGEIVDNRDRITEGLNLPKREGDIQFDRVTVHYKVLNDEELRQFELDIIHHQKIKRPVALTYKIDGKDFPRTMNDKEYPEMWSILKKTFNEKIEKYFTDHGFYLWLY
jgi:hypothetical protein